MTYCQSSVHGLEQSYVILLGFVCILDSLYHVVEALLDSEVNFSDQVQNTAAGKTSVAALMPYVSTEVNFLYYFHKIIFC